MAKHKYDVCVARKGKDDKTYWNKVGVILQTDKGHALKLESIPVGWDGWASLFEPKAKGENPEQQTSREKQRQAVKAGDDDVPW